MIDHHTTVCVYGYAPNGFYQARCTCGWQGPVRQQSGLAARTRAGDDANEHDAEEMSHE